MDDTIKLLTFVPKDRLLDT